MKKLILKTAIMKQLKTILLIFLISLFEGQRAYAQVPGTPYIVPTYYEEENFCTGGLTTQGTEFWITFGTNGEAPFNDVLLMLNIAAQNETTVTLTFTNNLNANGIATSGVADYKVQAGETFQIDLSKVQGNTATNNDNLGDMRPAVYQKYVPPHESGDFNKTLHITSGSPISLYAFNTGVATTDATLVLPVTTWGEEYYRLSSSPVDSSSRDVEMFIASQDDTVITVNGSVLTTLDAGHVYYRSLPTDGTGNHITGSPGKPVAYFTHVTGSQIPSDIVSVDILFEQLQPVSQWGNEFLVPNASQGAVNLHNRIRIIASADDTVVNFSGAQISFDAGQMIGNGGILDAGQWTELDITPSSSMCYIKTSKPVGVAAYMRGANSNPNSGDPSIAWIPPLVQSVVKVLISPFLFPVNSQENTFLDAPGSTHYMFIIAKTGEDGAIRNQTTVSRDNVNVALNNTTGWVDNTEAGYSYYYYEFDTPQSTTDTGDLGKSFSIANPEGVIVLCGGIGDFESYYYNAGGGACTINP
jgi:hypothetical protein